jgi:uncharacterized protein YbcI
MANPKTIGELEADITKQIIQFEKNYLGRGPVEARTHLLHDMVLIRLKGVLTPAEEKLLETREGKTLVKETRRQLFDTSRPAMNQLVNEILNANLIDLFSDISLDTGERVIVLTLDRQIVASPK